MFVSCICPTFRHPPLLANSLALWEMQDYPAGQRELIILDDAGTFNNQRGDNWALVSRMTRMPSLPAKYNALMQMSRSETDAFVVWEDDDLYLPSYISQHVEILKQHELSKPDKVWTDCGHGRTMQYEDAAGRFHATLAFRTELIAMVGGYPDSKRADFDLQLIGSLEKNCKSKGSPWNNAHAAQFVFRWHTGHAHGQWCSRSGPGDETWYERANELYKPVDFVGELVPNLDEDAKRIFALLGRELPCESPTEPIRP